MVNFIENYWNLHNRGIPDREIAKEMNMHRSTLSKWKKFYGIPSVRMNYQGLTEEQLQKGESIGLTRRIMYQRVRDNGYTANEACSTPWYVSKKERRKNG